MTGFPDTRTIARKPTRRQLKALDKQIEQLYYRHAAGRQIDILKIGKVYDACRQAAAAGQDIEAAMIAAVAQYCEPLAAAGEVAR